ncbi:MAG: hypothetical protein AB1510_09370 [Bacillota bacterium]
MAGLVVVVAGFVVVVVVGFVVVVVVGFVVVVPGIFDPWQAAQLLPIEGVAFTGSEPKLVSPTTSNPATASARPEKNLFMCRCSFLHGFGGNRFPFGNDGISG